jgi:tetratricopeptide (TPR) repeat protein/transcriptional regulator with XRE-family HTH domain
MVKKAAQATPNQLLRRARLERGWTQKVVADRIGAPNDMMVTRWERGTTFPSAYYIERLCQLFEQRASDLGLLPESHHGEPPSPAAVDLDAERELKHTSTASIDLAFPPVAAFLLDPAIPQVARNEGRLVGRADLLLQVKQVLAGASGGTAIALHGLPGMGKTALAMALAADPAVRDRFRDGILWAGLGQKPDVLGHLARWGKLLGVSPSTVEDVNNQVSWGQALRAAIGQRRLLLVIDDAWDGEDALAFQIGDERCAHLLTSRLPHVAFAFAGEQVLTVPELKQADGMALLARYVPTVVAQDRENTQALVQAAGSSPLALTLMGNYLAAQAFTGQTRRLRDALTQLQKAERRLHVSVPTGSGKRPTSLPPDIPFSLHSVIALSDQRLSTQARVALRALSVFPPKPNSFSEEAALAVSADAVETLDELWDAGLLESSGPGYYTLHQTIGDYARMQGQETEALQRLVAYMVWFVRTHEEDYDALEREQSNIQAALDAAEQLDMSQELLQGVMALIPFMRIRGHYTLANRLLMQAFQASLVQEEMQERLVVLRNQASFAELRGDYGHAERYSQEGLRLARDLGGQGEAECAFLTTLGLVAFQRGDYTLAKVVLEEGLQLSRLFGNRERICTLLIHLGGVLYFQGDFPQAEILYQEGLELARQFELFELMPVLLNYLGALSQSQGRYQDAEHYYLEGLPLARSLGHREHLSTLLNNLGDMAYHRGDIVQAIAYTQEGLTLARQIGLRAMVCLLLSNLGAMAIEQGDYVQAEQYIREGISLSQQLENQNYVTFLLAHLGSALGGQGNYEQANASFQKSLDLARSHNSPWHISKTLSKWGEVHIKFLELNAADAVFQEVLIYGRNDGGDPESLAKALYGLARIAALHSNITEATHLGQESAMHFEKIGHYKAREVREWLLSLPSSTS